MGDIFNTKNTIKTFKLGELCRQIAEKSIEAQLNDFWNNLEIELKENAKKGRLIYKKNVNLNDFENKKEFLDALSKRCKENGISMSVGRKEKPEPVVIDDGLDTIYFHDEIIFNYGIEK